MRIITAWLGLGLLLTADVIAETADTNPVVLKQQNGSACLTVRVVAAQSHLCAYRDPLNPKTCYPYGRVVLSGCRSSGDGQQWYYDSLNSIIHSTDYSSAMCLTRTVDSLEMIPCVTGSLAQSWQFNADDLLGSALDRATGQSYLQLLDGETFEQLPLVKASLDQSGADDPEPPPAQEPEPSVSSWEEVPEGSYWVSGKVTGDLRLQVDGADSCLGMVMPAGCETGRICFARAKVQLRQCDFSDNEIWRHDLRTKHLYVKKAGYRFCLTWLHGKLKMFGCFAGGVPAQKWYFARGKTSFSPERGLLRSSAKGINEPYEYVQSLNRPEQLNKRKPVRLRVEVLPGRNPGSESCGFDPVTGDVLESC
ncbi:MAG: hypothetical protein ACR2PT_20120 [Endozoicomonas sp.]